jgi:hypothetical protein
MLLPPRSVLQLRILFGGLQVRVACPAVPQVGLGVVLLGKDLDQYLACAFGYHVDLGAAGLLVAACQCLAVHSACAAPYVQSGTFLRVSGCAEREGKVSGQVVCSRIG